MLGLILDVDLNICKMNEKRTNIQLYKDIYYNHNKCGILITSKKVINRLNKIKNSCTFNLSLHIQNMLLLII